MSLTPNMDPKPGIKLADIVVDDFDKLVAEMRHMYPHLNHLSDLDMLSILEGAFIGFSKLPRAELSTRECWQVDTVLPAISSFLT